jgi:hypothetical protein
MRNESMTFVASALLITFLTANVARARPDLNHPLDTSSPIWTTVMMMSNRLPIWPRMFSWSVCSIQPNGSEPLTDSMNHWPLQHTQDPPRLKQVCNHGCVDDDGDKEEMRHVNLAAGATFLDRAGTDPAWSVCDLGNLRHASLPLA